MFGRGRSGILVSCALAVGLATGTPLAAETLELKAAYRSFSGAKECEASVTKRLKVAGPGEATIRIRLDPYRSAGKIDLIPVRFNEVRNGRLQGWALTPGFDWVATEVTQAGRKTTGAWVDGLPLEKVSTYRLGARTYELDVALSPPCQLHGSGGFEQWSQRSQVTIETGASGSSGPAVVPTSAARPGPRLAGRWVAKVGGKKTGDCSVEESDRGLVFVIHRTPAERSTGRFVDGTTVVADQWGPQRGRVSADGRRIEWEGSVWERVDDAKEGRSTTPAPPPRLAGRWEAWAGGKKTGDCSIEEKDGGLVFVIHRTPPERSTGRYVDGTTVVADAWGPQRGRVSPDGRRIDWASSFWRRVD